MKKFNFMKQKKEGKIDFRASKLTVAIIILSMILMILPTAVKADKILFSENFDSLPLEPAIWESHGDGVDFTHNPPTGWSIDNSSLPDGGVPEWSGWSFSDWQFWVDTHGQERGNFTNGNGVIAVADPDEWDDESHDPGTYNTFLSTPTISLDGISEDTVYLTFDSSWRGYANQTATLMVAYNDGAKIEIFRWEDDDDRYNETLTYALHNPAGATNMVLEFGLIDAGNDWWWAIDNLEVTGQYNTTCFTQNDLDAQFEAGKQYCTNNPEACGWLGGYTQSDLDNARQEGYNSGCNDCSNGSSIPATISPELNLHIPVLQYQSPFGAMDLWADFEFAGESDGDMLWKLSDFGQN